MTQDADAGLDPAADWRTTVTREGLRNGSLMAAARRLLPPGTSFLSDAENRSRPGCHVGPKRARRRMAVRLWLADVEPGDRVCRMPPRRPAWLAQALLPVAARRPRVANQTRPDARTGTWRTLRRTVVPHSCRRSAVGVAAGVATRTVHRRLPVSLGDRQNRHRAGACRHLRPPTVHTCATPGVSTIGWRPHISRPRRALSAAVPPISRQHSRHCMRPGCATEG